MNSPEQRKRRTPGQPLEVTVEIEYVSAEEAPGLARQQTEAIYDVLQWLADHHGVEEAGQRPEDTP